MGISPSIDNVKNISWDESTNTWRARMTVGGLRKSIAQSRNLGYVIDKYNSFAKSNKKDQIKNYHVRSHVHGVHWDRKRNLWKVEVRFQDEYSFGGRFYSFREALKARNKIARNMNIPVVN